MADRDALIVICWLVILILVFFECFHRKLKARFGGEIRPPPNTRRSASSPSSDGLSIGGTSSLPNYRRVDLLAPTLGNNMMSINRGSRFTGPIAITTSTSASDTGNNYCSGSSKEVCRIPMTTMMMMSFESVEDEEPPPTYEEALSYAKFLSKLPSSPPYDVVDQSIIVQCEDNTDNNVNINGDGDDKLSSFNNNTNANSNVPQTTATTRTTTTAIFVNEEESSEDEEDEDDDDESTSNQSANDTDNESHTSTIYDDEDSKWDSNNNNGNDGFTSATIGENASIVSKRLDYNSRDQQGSQDQCNKKNVNVIISSSSSNSKSLDRIEIHCDINDKMKITSGSNKSEKIKSVSQSTKLPPPPPPPGNIV